MKSPILSCALVITLSLGALGAIYAGSATWSANPISGDWNTAVNWIPNTVPNGPSDTATFNTSSITDISLSATVEVEGIVFNAGASEFTTSCLKNLTISGTGIANSSGVTQSFISKSRPSPITFTHAATAGSDTAFTNDQGYIEFDDNSSGGSAIFTTTSNGITIFLDQATCGSATFINNHGTTYPKNGANAIFINNSGGLTFFGDGTFAGPGNATLIANDGSSGVMGGTIYISDGGETTARAEIFGNGYLDLSNTFVIQLGSIEGDGTIEIGDSEVTVGINNLSTVFGGLIQDLVTEGSGGTLIKVGSGTLTLSSSNSYRNNTIVSGGTLIVANTNGSATGTGTVKVNSSTLGGRGIITGAVTIGTGSGMGAILAPAHGTTTKTTLKIKNELVLNSDATYTYTYKAKSNTAKTDKVVAKGVTINSGATLDFDGMINGRLTPGLVFTVISNTSANPISGNFSNLPDGSTVVLAGNTFQVSYSGGDGNDLTLTVVP